LGKREIEFVELAQTRFHKKQQSTALPKAKTCCNEIEAFGYYLSEFGITRMCMGLRGLAWQQARQRASSISTKQNPIAQWHRVLLLLL
jgi:hypothetical protein